MSLDESQWLHVFLQSKSKLKKMCWRANIDVNEHN